MAKLGSFLQGIESLRGIEWSKSWLWDIKFGGGADSNLNPPPPSPFDTWFPATNYSETANISNTLVVPYYLGQYKFLQTKGSTDLQIDFHDDINGTLYNWMSDWFDYVLDDSDGVCMLNDAWKQLTILKLNSQREPIRQYNYYVVPEGSITEQLTSQTDTKHYSASFAVIGRLPSTEIPENRNNARQSI